MSTTLASPEKITLLSRDAVVTRRWECAVVFWHREISICRTTRPGTFVLGRYLCFFFLDTLWA